MKNKEIEIKRLAQFIFDNAKMISKQLLKTDSYRSMSIYLHQFKSGSAKLKSDLNIVVQMYDETVDFYKLENEEVCLQEFKKICKQMDIATGSVKLPEPVEVRDKL